MSQLAAVVSLLLDIVGAVLLLGSLMGRLPASMSEALAGLGVVAGALAVVVGAFLGRIAWLCWKAQRTQPYLEGGTGW